MPSRVLIGGLPSTAIGGSGNDELGTFSETSFNELVIKELKVDTFNSLMTDAYKLLEQTKKL